MIDPVTQLRADEAGLPASESHPDAPLACFPLRTDWEATLNALSDSQPWPPAEISSHSVAANYLGMTAFSGLVKLGQEKGWITVCQHARGCWPTIGQKPSRQRDSLMVSFLKGSTMMVAVYVEGITPGTGWSWDTLYRWSTGEHPAKLQTVTQLKALL